VTRNTDIVITASSLLLFRMKIQDPTQDRNMMGAVMIWKPYDTASYNFCPSVPKRLIIWKKAEVQKSNQSICLQIAQTHAYLLC
jgi:hypothetical protein